MQARDSTTGREVAVKTILLKHISPQQKHQLLRGCRIHIACSNIPHVLPFYIALQV
jgi:hypothetical protein